MNYRKNRSPAPIQENSNKTKTQRSNKPINIEQISRIIIARTSVTQRCVREHPPFTSEALVSKFCHQNI